MTALTAKTATLEQQVVFEAGRRTSHGELGDCRALLTITVDGVMVQNTKGLEHFSTERSSCVVERPVRGAVERLRQLVVVYKGGNGRLASF